jgi:hypothetical protein
MIKTTLAILLATCSITFAADRPIPAKPETGLAANATTPEYEKALAERAKSRIEGGTPQDKNLRANTFFENEKGGYPRLFFAYLSGRQADALKALQGEDADAKRWHAHTQGIDWFPCFTIKAQVRKYFAFKDEMDPAYTKRMFDGAKAWTEKDPAKQPHPAYKGPKTKEDWTPEHNNAWVDMRTTDNLTYMRETSIYLMAEETGNEETRKLYKDKLRTHVHMMYNVGMGEWDSKNYVSHSFTPWLNLYDYTTDPETKMLAKGALDYMSARAAIKYWRGGWNGPTKREGWNATPFGVHASQLFSYYFGPAANPKVSTEEVFAIMSGYRPPQAVVALAERKIELPMEFRLTHPGYENYKSFPATDVKKPVYYETQYLSDSFMLGSLERGNWSDGIDDVNGFSIMTFNSTRGVDYIVAGTYVTDPVKVATSTNGKDRIQQSGNQLMWGNDDADVRYTFQVPKSAKISTEKNVVTIQLEKTRVMIGMQQATWSGVDDKMTAELAEKRKIDTEQIVHITSEPGKRGMLQIVVLEPGQEPKPGISVPGGLPMHPILSAQEGIVDHRWKSGVFTVEAGGLRWTGKTDEKGSYSFTEGPAK